MADTETFERSDDVEKDAPGVVRRWLLEIKLADKREEKWRATSNRILDKYRQKDSKRHSFNILWSNTETLRQAVYNSLPKPDVRRRFKDDDPIGKNVSTVLSRSLEYMLDTSDFDNNIQSIVLDMLLPGRGVARVRYVPSLQQVGVTAEAHDEDDELHADGGEALEGDAEEVEWEQAIIEQVQWDEFRILSSAKKWSEVCAIAFKHELTRDEIVKQFGEVGELVNLSDTEDDTLNGEKDAGLVESFKTAVVWEIWDKEEGEVIFVSPAYKEAPLKTVADPLNLQGFFPIPRPIYAIEDSSRLVPQPLYEQYKEQAEELNRISVRINKLTDGLKNRGIYDATLTELAELMKGEDNDLIPAQNVTALLERGGLNAAIWFMPIEQAAKVLQALYVQREQTKQIIYELTGISDIMRSASDPQETFGAQKIKTQWGTQRLQRMQKEVQRFVRDLIRIQSEIIAEKFSPETLATMTGVKLPHQAEVEQQFALQMQQYQAQMQQMQMQPQQPGQPPKQPPAPPQMPQVVTWEAVLQVMRDDKQRQFRVDVETDSTVAATQDEDMAGLTQVLTAVIQLIEKSAPAVMSGALPVEAVKELVMTVCRRAKMGNAVEDTLDKMQPPKPPPDPNAGQAQIEQAKMQATMQMEQMKAQLADQQHQRETEQNMQLEQWKQQQQAAQIQQQNEIQAQREAQKMQLEAARDEQKQALALQLDAQKQEFERWKTELQEATKITVAEIGAKTTLSTSLMGAQETANAEVSESIVNDGPSLGDIHALLSDMMKQAQAPKTIERGPDGKAVSVGGRSVVRGPDGKAIGIQ